MKTICGFVVLGVMYFVGAKVLNKEISGYEALVLVLLAFNLQAQIGF